MKKPEFFPSVLARSANPTKPTRDLRGQLVFTLLERWTLEVILNRWMWCLLDDFAVR